MGIAANTKVRLKQPVDLSRLETITYIIVWVGACFYAILHVLLYSLGKLFLIKCWNLTIRAWEQGRLSESRFHRDTIVCFFFSPGGGGVFENMKKPMAEGCANGGFSKLTRWQKMEKFFYANEWR